MNTLRIVALLLVWLLPSCAGSGTPAPLGQQLLPILTGFGDAAVRLYLAPAIAERAPALLPLLDTDSDGVVTLEELQAADLSSPALAVALLLTIERLIKR
jgi:hypothetical protein